MRFAVGTILIFLLVAAVLLTLWVSRPVADADATPPGQYPVDAARFAWPATEVTATYGPAKGMGSNKVRFAGGDDVKARCATDTTCSE
jgi:hypothetical protein